MFKYDIKYKYIEKLSNSNQRNAFTVLKPMTTGLKMVTEQKFPKLAASKKKMRTHF